MTATARVPELIAEKEVEQRWPYFADKELRSARQRCAIAFYPLGTGIHYAEADIAC